MLATAYRLAATEFENIKDKSGEPYFTHCLNVMNNLNSQDEELRCIAILHDIVEDTTITFHDLKTMGFSDRVIDALKLLTHDKDVPYDDYIYDIAFSGNEDARRVKLADLTDNLSVTRLKGLTRKDDIRIHKYHAAYTYLSKV